MKKILYFALSMLSLAACHANVQPDGPHDPKVLSILPKAGYPGTEAVISGWYFEGKDVSVTVGGTAAEIQSVSMDRIHIIMPSQELGTYDVVVRVDGREAGGIRFRYAEHPEEEHLSVLSCAPTHGIEGEQVSLTGTLFSPKADRNEVRINGKACEVLSASLNKLVVRVPDNPEGVYPFVVKVGNEEATGAPFTFDKKPEVSVTAISPVMGVVGEELTIQGISFSSVPSENEVTLGGVKAEVLSATSRELHVKVPQNPLGSYPVVVTVGGKSATGPSFLYISKKWKHTVKTISGSAGRAADNKNVIDGGPSQVKYWQPRGLVFLPDGRMAIFDNGNNAIRFMNLSNYNVISTTSAKDLLNAAWRGCVHGDWIYLASKGNNRIVRYNYKTDESSQVNASITGTSPMDVAFDKDGNGYVLVRDGSKSIFKAQGDDFSSMEVFAAFDDGPLAMEFAPDGQLIVSTNGCQIYAVAPDGTKQAIAGIRGAKADDSGTPGQPLTAKFGSNLFGLTLDPEGNIYVADDSFKIIRLILKGEQGYEDAIVSTVAGLSGKSGRADGTGSDARFHTPGEIRMAPDGRHLYVSEYSAFTIREISIE